MSARPMHPGGRQPHIGIVRRCQAFPFKLRRLLSGSSVVGGLTFGAAIGSFICVMIITVAVFGLELGVLLL